ncbi:uncharacterized protein [Nicotiana tomentosiformis]|uniref:uncharacterized protein n=1 Tax=Nicotiana tomentosiformis TaxID=4098 RepID=UPI00388C5C22
MVIAWITNSLYKDIANSVMDFDTAKDIWDDINERFGTSNVSKYIQIQREVSVASQGPVCTCGALLKFIEQQKIYQFLSGLNELYSTCKSNILMMSSLPSLSKAYSMLQHDEKQKETSVPISIFSNESASFNASSSPVQAPARSFTQRFQFEQKRGSRSSSQLSCKYCKKTGHTIEKCYKLHGFPPDFKFTKGKRSVVCVQSEGPFHHHAHTNGQSSETTGHGFSKEQYDYLTTLLQQLNHPPIIYHEPPGSENIGFAHFAGVFNHPEVHSAAFHACGPSLRRPREIGKAANGLYFLQPIMTSSAMSAASFPVVVSNHVEYNNSSASYNAQSISTSVPLTHCTTCTSSDINKNDVIWHQRLGHLDHIDIWGPYNTQTYNGFRSDNAYELGSSSEAQQFFSANGILHQTTIPHTLQ